MNCPVCRTPMLVLEYEQVEVDFCGACRGIWLDEGELELLFGDADACAALLCGQTAPARGEKPRKCPICRRRMAKGVTSADKPVMYDLCPRGDGLWFDRGELDTVLEQGKGFGGVGEFLRGIFHGD